MNYIYYDFAGGCFVDEHDLYEEWRRAVYNGTASCCEDYTDYVERLRQQGIIEVRGLND